MTLPDIQKTPPKHNLKIDRVGVENIKTFINFKKKGNSLINLSVTIDSYSSLHKDIRGTNMSRFLEVFNDIDILSQQTLKEILIKLRKSLKLDDIYLKISFEYPIEKISPVSKKSSTEPVAASFIGMLKNNKFQFVLELNVPVTSLCPCSKQISKYNAHNQRSIIKLQTIPLEFIWIEDIVEVIEHCGSSKIYPLLKRRDEKWVTETMYENPKFVEDMVREVGVRIKNLNISWYKVKVTNFESIHSHNAVAYLAERKIKGKWLSYQSSFY